MLFAVGRWPLVRALLRTPTPFSRARADSGKGRWIEGATSPAVRGLPHVLPPPVAPPQCKSDNDTHTCIDPDARAEAQHAAAPLTFSGSASGSIVPQTAAAAARALQAETHGKRGPASMALPALLAKIAISRSAAHARESHPYRQSLQDGIPVHDEAMLRLAVHCIILSRALYNEKLLSKRDLDLEVPGEGSRRLRARILSYQEAPGSSFRNSYALCCHICASPFLLAGVRQKALSVAQMRSTSATRRYHCPECHQSVCAGCSDKGDEGRLCHVCRDSGPPALRSEMHYGLMRLHQDRVLALVFRGTASHSDMVIDGKTKPRNILQHHADATAAGHSLFVHGGVAEQIDLAYDHIKADLLAACNAPENRGLKLAFAGHSLGGAYATVLAIRLLLDPETQPVLMAHEFEVLSFGAPRVIFDAGRLTEGLEATLPPAARLTAAEEEAAVTAASSTSTRRVTTTATATDADTDTDGAKRGVTAPSPATQALNRRRATAAVAAALERAVQKFYSTRFRFFVNESDIVPRLLGNKISGLGVAAQTVKHFARSVFSVQLRPSEVEVELHHYVHLGAVFALVSGQPCLHIPPGPPTDKFFRLFPFDFNSAFQFHRTALYEMRLLAAYEALVTAREEVRPTPDMAAPSFTPSDDDLSHEPVDPEVRESFIAHLTSAASKGLFAPDEEHEGGADHDDDEESSEGKVRSEGSAG